MITPTPRPLDIAEFFPEMRFLAKPATRLHPRRGEPGIHESSIGGRFLWPAKEPWPVCRLPRMVRRERPMTLEELQNHRERSDLHRERRERMLADPDTPDEVKQTLRKFAQGFEESRAAAEAPRVVITWPVETPVVADPMVGLLQLRAADAPSVTFPDGADLMQLLWCPHNHQDVPANPHHLGPAPLLVWRRAADVKDVLTDVPPVTADARRGHYLPLPCTVSPEQVIEYPDIDDLPDGLRDRIQTWSDDLEAERGLSYQRDLSTAPGWKVGGWPYWYQDPCPLTCECGADMTLLLNIASSEWSSRSWRPPEDQHFPDRGTAGLHIAEPTDVIVGRRGEMRMFWCSRDHRHPLMMVTQ